MCVGGGGGLYVLGQPGGNLMARGYSFNFTTG